MLKMLLKILRFKRAKEIKCKNAEVFLKNNLFHNLTSALLVLCSSTLFLIASCAPKHIETPTYEGISIKEALTELKNTKAIEAVLFVQYEKGDSVMSGDASIAITENSLIMRLYYLGFLAGEIYEDNGVIKSKPQMNKVKSTMLVDGLKNSFLWWNIADYTIYNKDNIYEIRNSYRKLLINKQTLLPVEQTIELHNGDNLYIYYDAPKKIQAGEEITQSYIDSLSFLQKWYQSSMRIEYKNQIVRITVKSYLVKQ